MPHSARDDIENQIDSYNLILESYDQIIQDLILNGFKLDPRILSVLAGVVGNTAMSVSPFLKFSAKAAENANILPPFTNIEQSSRGKISTASSVSINFFLNLSTNQKAIEEELESFFGLLCLKKTRNLEQSLHQLELNRTRLAKLLALRLVTYPLSIRSAAAFAGMVPQDYRYSTDFAFLFLHLGPSKLVVQHFIINPTAWLYQKTLQKLPYAPQLFSETTTEEKLAAKLQARRLARLPAALEVIQDRMRKNESVVDLAELFKTTPSDSNGPKIHDVVEKIINYAKGKDPKKYQNSLEKYTTYFCRIVTIVGLPSLFGYFWQTLRELQCNFIDGIISFSPFFASAAAYSIPVADKLAYFISHPIKSFQEMPYALSRHKLLVSVSSFSFLMAAIYSSYGSLALSHEHDSVPAYWLTQLSQKCDYILNLPPISNSSYTNDCIILPPQEILDKCGFYNDAHYIIRNILDTLAVSQTSLFNYAGVPFATKLVVTLFEKIKHQLGVKAEHTINLKILNFIEQLASVFDRQPLDVFIAEMKAIDASSTKLGIQSETYFETVFGVSFCDLKKLDNDFEIYSSFRDFFEQVKPNLSSSYVENLRSQLDSASNPLPQRKSTILGKLKAQFFSCSQDETNEKKKLIQVQDNPTGDNNSGDYCPKVCNVM